MNSSTVPNIDTVWERIKSYEGEVFYTFKALPFKYSINKDMLQVSETYPNQIDKSIDRDLPKIQFKNALKKVPISTPTKISYLHGYEHIWGILNDCRIRDNDWAACAFNDGNY